MLVRVRGHARLCCEGLWYGRDLAGMHLWQPHRDVPGIALVCGPRRHRLARITCPRRNDSVPARDRIWIPNRQRDDHLVQCEMENRRHRQKRTDTARGGERADRRTDSRPAPRFQWLVQPSRLGHVQGTRLLRHGDVPVGWSFGYDHLCRTRRPERRSGGNVRRSGGQVRFAELRSSLRRHAAENNRCVRLPATGFRRLVQPSDHVRVHRPRRHVGLRTVQRRLRGP